MNGGNYCRPLWLFQEWQTAESEMVCFMYFYYMRKNPKLLNRDRMLKKQALLVRSTRLEF